MFAVVQIGSKERKSPCITALSVFAAAGISFARPIAGAAMSVAAATLPWTKRRRVVPIFILPFSLPRGLIHGRNEAASGKMAINISQGRVLAQRTKRPSGLGSSGHSGRLTLVKGWLRQLIGTLPLPSA